MLVIHVMAWDRHKHVNGLNQIKYIILVQMQILKSIFVPKLYEFQRIYHANLIHVYMVQLVTIQTMTGSYVTVELAMKGSLVIPEVSSRI